MEPFSLLADLCKQYGFDGVVLGSVCLLLRRYWGFKTKRILIVATGLILIAPYHYYKYRYFGLPYSFGENEIGILIAEVPGDTNREHQNAYAQAIRERIRSFPDLVESVKVRILERSLPDDPERQQAEALKIGHWLHASFVLRPFTAEGIQEPWLTVVDQAPFLFPYSETPLRRFPNAELGHLDELQLPADILLVTRSTIAVLFLEKKSYQKAISELQDILSSPDWPEIAPSQATIYQLLGFAFLGTNDDEKALDAFQKAVAVDPQNADAHVHLGLSFQSISKTDEAIEQERTAIKLNPRLVVAHVDLCEFLALKGDFRGAMGECQSAAILAPDDFQVRFAVGGVYADLNEYDNAIREYKRAIKLKPDQYFAHYNLAVAYDHSGQRNRAIEQYELAIAFYPDFAQALVNLGLDFMYEHDPKDAMAEYRRAIEVAPKFPEGYENLCSALYTIGQKDDAISECDRAISINPKSFVSYFNLGNAQSAKGWDRQAVLSYESAIALDPDLAIAHRYLGQTLLKLGQPAEAFQELKEANRLQSETSNQPHSR